MNNGLSEAKSYDLEMQVIPLSEVERLIEVKVRQVLTEMLGITNQPEP